MRARSFLPLGLMPAAMPEARMAGTAGSPPSSRRVAGAKAGGEEAGDRGHSPPQPLDVGHAAYGYTGGASRPVRSSHPIMMLRLWIPLADPPLPRLSSADKQTAAAGRRPRHPRPRA